MKIEKRKYKPLKEGKYDIRRDDVFKIVFGSNERSEYLKAFLESILHKKITNIVIRNDSYASGIYYNSLKTGKKYIEATKTIVIWILGYNYFEDGNYHEIIKQRREYNNEVFSPNITTHIFQLPRFIETVDEIRTEEEQWLAYLSGNLNKEEKEELFKMNRSIEEINKILDIVITDDDVWDAINDRILAQQLENLKMQRSHENGVKKVAKEMLKDGFDIEKIAKLTGLEESEIIDLKD